jgi:hypothetical protein
VIKAWMFALGATTTITTHHNGDERCVFIWMT